MQVLNRSIIYENPMPQLRSRQSVFPYLCEREDGAILAAHCVGEAFESIDLATCLSVSRDGGFTFTYEGPLFSQGQGWGNYSESCKISRLGGSRLAAFGYAYDRSDSSLPIGNPETGGLLDDVVFLSQSEDNGRSWSPWQQIDCRWGPHAEASAPLSVLADGSWASPITGFADWQGKYTSRNCGRLLRSSDRGKTWNDDVVCMAFENDEVTCFEQRLCQLASGKLVCIGWNENLRSGERLPNHYTVSTDGGKSFSSPRSTGIRGQASSICAIGGEKLLALHALRRDTERPGIYAYVVDLGRNLWDIEDELIIMEPAAPIVQDKNMAEIFSFLKFGQPGAILLKNGKILACHWRQEHGQYITAATLISL